MPINFPSNPNINDTYNSAGTTWTYDGAVWNVVSSSSTVAAPSTNNFQNVAVTGQATVTADSPSDTLNLVAGSNITITTNAATDSITINSTASGGGGAGNTFANIAVTGQNSVVADNSNDTLNLVAGSNITITTDAATDSITINSTASGGASNFSALTDANNAGLTVDEIYLPAITMLAVGNVGATSYTFDQYSGNNPTIYAISGTTIAFKINAAGHPFAIQDGFGNLYNTGLIHVSTTGVVSTGLSAQGKDSGTLYWKVPIGISGGYRYQCTAHAPMVGSINIKSFVII